MNDRPRRTTLRDLAKAAGASTATVSLVLNGAWETHRITPETAGRIRDMANRLDYQPSTRARALRLGRSSLAGLMIPHHRNRFFAGLTENFEAQCHRRGLVPIVGSTQRSPEIEMKIARSMLAQEVELLVLAGVAEPSRINRMCLRDGVRCVNVDLPGPEAFSIVTDNEGGAHALTQRLLDGLEWGAHVVFLGGRADEYATDLRVRGFRRALVERDWPAERIAVLRCGYDPADARRTVADLVGSDPARPRAFLVNSITAFEGFATCWRDGRDAFGAVRVACFDWDPFASCLPIKTIMLRQNVEAMIARCFDWFDHGEDRRGEVVMVPPQMPSVGPEASTP
jgi:LacI family fructose operon transcriptional repressor